MTPSEIRKLFPKEVQITQEMLDAVDSKYLGELCLKSFLPIEEHDNIFWGLSIGFIKGVELKVERWNDTAKMNVPWYLNEIHTPTTIKFTLRTHKLNNNDNPHIKQ